MKLSTKARYGLRVMLELALRHGQGPVMMSKIAVAQEISRKYLHNLLTMLKLAGYVLAVRGAAGGYLLAREPGEIRLGELIESLEGSLALVDCVTNPEVCDRHPRCVTRDLWSEVGQAARAVLDAMTLEDLVERHRQKVGGVLDYNI